MEDRKYYIDLLKTLGISLIILAHVDAPKWIFMIRCFDVPLMVILSGVLAQKSNTTPKFDYYVKRICRLLAPTWMFLLFYFSITYALGERYSRMKIIKTFMLQQDSIGYVWIIWVYLLCAFWTPALKKIPLNGVSVGTMVIVYILYELAYKLKVGVDIRVIYYTFYYLPYIMLTFYGLNFEKIRKKLKLIIAVVVIDIWFGMAMYYYNNGGSWVYVQTAKYPPRLYFLSYSVGISTLLMLLTEGKCYKCMNNGIVRFISSHSLWIYLWHIFLLFIVNHWFNQMLWIKQYIIIFISSVILTYIQNKVVDRISKNKDVKCLTIFRG